MTDKVDYHKLRSLNIFRDFDKNEIDAACKHFFVRNLEKDSVLFSEGMTGELLYIIISGRVEIIKKTKDGRKIILATMGANEIVGEMSLIESAPRTATGKTCEDSVLMVITKSAFNQILDSNPRTLFLKVQ